jgi:hypothetical protein
LVSPLFVNKRKNGKIYVFDGNRRRLALREVKEQKCWCLLAKGMTKQDEAHWYDVLNGHIRKTTKTQAFKARIVAKEPKALQIKAVLAKHGFIVDVEDQFKDSIRKEVGRYVRAIHAVEQIWDRDGPTATELLFRLLGEAFSVDDKYRCDGTIIKGVQRFLMFPKWSGKWEYSRLLKKLTLIGAERLLRTARRRDDGNLGPVQAVALVVMEKYNAGWPSASPKRLWDPMKDLKDAG